MILLEIQCPRCKRKQQWLSYKVTSRDQVAGKQTTCKACGKSFKIKGTGYPQVDRIVKELRFRP